MRVHAQVNDYGDAVGIICRSELTHDNLQRVRERFEGPRKPRFKDLFRTHNQRAHSESQHSNPYGTTEALELFPHNRAFTAVEVPARVGEFDASADTIVPPSSLQVDSDSLRRAASGVGRRVTSAK